MKTIRQTIAEKLHLSERSSFWLMFFLLVVAIMAGTILPVTTQNRELRQKISELEREISELKSQNTHYSKEIEAIQSNPVYIEFLLREKLRYGKKGETIFPSDK